MKIPKLNQQVKHTPASPESSNRYNFTDNKHPKSGPRKYQKGDMEKYQQSSLWCPTCGFGKSSCKCEASDS